MIDDPPRIPGFTFIAEVGIGGMSTVWKARDQASGKIVAVKILNREFSRNREDISAFRSEGVFMGEIRHPGIVEAYRFEQAGDTWFMTMEFVDGYTFADLLRRKRHIPEIDCLLICESVAAALDYAWNDHGIVHCDIKPENIMINSEGIVKLTDLGISHRFKASELSDRTVPDHVLGTPAYISPEQIYGDVEPDCRADIYSLAATLYHLAVGRVLFPNLDADASMRAHCDETVQAPDPRTYRPEISEGFAQLLEAMLVKNRDYRLSSWKMVFRMCREVERGVKFKPRMSEATSSIKLAQPN